MAEEKHSAETDSNTTLSVSDQMAVRLAKLTRLQQENQDPFEVVRFEVTHHAADIKQQFTELEGQTVTVAGRLMSRRGMGKVSFCDLQDRSGSIQIFSKIDLLGEDRYKLWQTLDLGDWVGVTGEVIKTQRGEISLRSHSFELLAKCVRPLPEKFHGLKDTDTRYRQRYLDLIMNPEVKKQFEARSLIITTIRRILNEKAFMEVETPILNVIPGGAAARPFITHHNALDIDLYLRIAPELYLKRLIVGGLERVYEIGRTFRNEGIDVKHNPEFTILELYQAYTDYQGMMDLTEYLIKSCCEAVNGTLEISWNGQALDLTQPFRRLSMRAAVLQYADVDFDLIADDQAAFALAEERQLEVQPGWHKGDVFNLFFETYVEDKLIQPTFIYDYPIEISPLTKKKPGRPDLTERFELFINGGELANAYSELNDPVDQRARFAAQAAKRDAGDDEANRLDEDFCVALEYGMPPTGGMGMGIDRLTMMLTDAASIRDVLLFPTMKPIDPAAN
ncbi:lysine--tRNA ligase [Oscillospiraceae bacterium HV4-5-C5C]|nr:lysine--tRNA ligase [Oscillospiraceae bacterium HV4-5-C5C]